MMRPKRVNILTYVLVWSLLILHGWFTRAFLNISRRCTFFSSWSRLLLLDPVLARSRRARRGAAGFGLGSSSVGTVAEGKIILLLQSREAVADGAGVIIAQS